MTNDGRNTLVYDGENRVFSSTQSGATTTYTYDGNGLRVRKCQPNCTSPTSSTVYVFSGTKVIAEYDNGAAAGSPSREYIYSGLQLLATVTGSGGSATTTYHHPDHLSVRVTTSATGSVLGQQGHYPFGELWYPLPPQTPATKWQFTSYERDSESGNDYALARSYVNRLGRFNSPDPLVGNPGDPQSFNRYAYVRNNPAGLVDPRGLDPCNGEQCLVIDLTAYGPHQIFGEPGDEVYAWYLGAVADAFSKARLDSLKKELKEIFKSNPKCAKIFGGLRNANALVDKMQVTNTDAPGWAIDPKASTDEKAIASAVANHINNLPAVTSFGGREGKPWDKKSFTVYVNNDFFDFSHEIQLTVFIHELHHVALGHTPATRALDQPSSYADLVAISDACHTKAPPPSDY